MSRETIAELNQKLVQHGVESVISYLVGSNNYENQTRTIGMAAYTGGKGHSFQVVKNGSDAGFWYENNASDAPNGQSTGDLVELWSLIKGISKGDTCKEIRDFLNIGSSHGLSNLSLVKPTPVKEKQRLAKKISVLKPSSELSIDKLEKRLHANEKALSFLFARSLNELTIRHFRLGLSQPYKKKDSDIVQQNALVVPIINKEGKYCTPNAFYNVPGVTENPINDNGWRGGGVNLCYNTAQKESHEWMIVAEGMKDLWALHQIIAGTDLEHRIIIVSSTHGSSLPIEVDNPMVFSGLVKVFLGHDADPSGNKMAENWAYKVGNKAYRLKPPFLFDKKGDDKDWTDFLKNGGTAKKLFSLLNDAHPIRTTGINKASNLKDIKPGKTYSYSPVDISGAYINGNLYYPIVALESGVDSSTGVMGYSRVVKVVRNDKKIYDYYTMPLLKRPGALSTPIYALSDGTIISDIPKIPPNASWQWEDIEAWIEGHYANRPLEVIVNDLVTIIRSQIWLPNENDYLILALVIVVTYVQNIFDAVPLVLATGTAGSGKSQLGTLMAKVAANGIVVGDTSAATIARTLDETRGFLMLDDVEKICSKVNSSNIQMDDFLQILKVSYKKATATKSVTDTKNMTVKTLNFYGVKFMTNTQGIEDVLGTRTITIHTSKSSKFTVSELDEELINSLKPELHAWSMDNAETLHQCYSKYPLSNRPLEITAPLRAIIDMAERPEWHEIIDDLIERMSIDQKCVNSPEQVVKEAAYQIAKRGFNSLTCEQVILEMKTLVPENYMKERTNDVPEWQQVDWVRHQLKNLNYIPSADSGRFRPYGKAPLSRLYVIEDKLFEDMEIKNLEQFSEIKRTKDGSKFCKDTTCSNCPYENTDCYIRQTTNKGFARR